MILIQLLLQTNNGITDYYVPLVSFYMPHVFDVVLDVVAPVLSCAPTKQ